MTRGRHVRHPVRLVAAFDFADDVPRRRVENRRPVGNAAVAIVLTSSLLAASNTRSTFDCAPPLNSCNVSWRARQFFCLQRRGSCEGDRETSLRGILENAPVLVRNMSTAAVVLLVLGGLVLVISSAVEGNVWTSLGFLVWGTALVITWRRAREAMQRVERLEKALQNERSERIARVAGLSARIAAVAAEERREELPRREEAPSAPPAAVVSQPVVEPPPVVNAPTVPEPQSAPAIVVGAPVVPPTPFVQASERERTAPERTAPRARTRSLLDLEQMLGVNWLSKVGVAVLVLGIAFFLAWQLRELGPLGKVVVGTMVALVLLGAGVWGDRQDRYRILGRASLAGGWSLLFFVSYAAHHISAARVIASPLIDFVLMLSVVAAMVAHTLRFRSQVVTGLAFSLAFTTIALTRADVFSLTANVILAIGFSFVVVRMRWFALEIIGILATYLNHYIWLWPIIEPMRGKVHPFPEFYTSAIILVLYWAVFRTSFVVRPPVDEKMSAFAGVLNTALLLGVMKYQAAHPELAFWVLLALGAVEIGFSRLPMMRRKRTSFIVLTTVGAALLVAAIPFRYAPAYVTPIWLIEAALFVFAGVITSERAYRRLGSLTAAATALQLLSVPGARLLGARLGGWPAVHEWVLGTICLAVMLALYADATWLPRRWPDLFRDSHDQRASRALGYLAAVVALLAGWALFPGSGAAVFWAALAVILAKSGRRFGLPDLTLQANVIAVLAIARVLIVNLPSNAAALNAPLHLTWRLLTVSVVAALVYLLSRWNRHDAVAVLRVCPRIATWTGSALLVLLAWYELLPVSVAVAWTIFGLVLMEIGETRRSSDLQLQAYSILIAAFVRVFVVNMNADHTAGIGARVYTVLPIAVALLYVYHRIDARQASELAAHRAWLAPLFAWLALICVAALLRFEFAADMVVIAWAALTVVLVAAAAFTDRRVFLHIGIALALATLSRGVLHNLYERSYFPPPGRLDRWLLVSAAAAVLFATLPFAFRSRRIEPAEDTRFWIRLGHWFDSRPEQILFFVPLLLVTALLETEMRRGMLTVAWGMEGVLVFVFALWVKERSYRLSGVALLLLCVGKIFLLDFWSLTLRDKALTGIVMGVALIGVSLLYTRKRDAILQFL